MTINVVAVHNPYWDLVASHVKTGYHGMPEMEAYPWPIEDNPVRRNALTDRFSWTITDPATVAFVAEHVGKAAIDPLAGTGYWAFLLGQYGVDVVASDHQPPNVVRNHFHEAGEVHVPVTLSDAVEAVRVHGQGRTLLLSWPPYENPIGVNVLRAFKGDRVVYIGEGAYGCCGDDAMFDLFASDWSVVVEHRPVQFGGIHDYVTVYERQAAFR